jgi:glutamyl-tRNA synthetase
VTEPLQVRVRFAPSPSGDLHVGNVRTALFDWAFARHTGGVFVLRIEDTDRSRVTPEHISSALDTLRWLGLDWDEGPGLGGSYGPYLQSQRLHIYEEWISKFLESGNAYRCYCSPAELAQRRDAARAAGGPSGYDGRCRELTAAQVAGYEAEGRQPVMRFRMTAGSVTFTDLVRGPVTFDHRNVPDFTLTRADGSPLYTLAVAVDDVLMRITHVVRGDDLLASTPRQLAVYRAMGMPEAEFPVFAHLPQVLGLGGEKLGKRYGAASVSWYRSQGFLPEAVSNYLALLGWSPGDDRESFTLAEMAAEFDLARVNRNPARFDVAKLEAINGDKIRALEPEAFAALLVPFLQRAGLVSDPPSAEQAAVLAAAAPLIQERISVLGQAPQMLGFLLVREADFAIDPDDAAKFLGSGNAEVLRVALAALAGLPEGQESWQMAAIETALRDALVVGLGLKPRVAFGGAVRVAVTGRRQGPPLFESLELLGRERTLGRLERAAQHAASQGPAAEGT